MLQFAGSIDGRRYALRMGGALLLFAAFQLVFPYITYALAMVSGCGVTAGACGVMASIIPMALKPLALLVLCAYMLSWCVRRARGLGLPAWAGLVVPLLVSSDWATFAVFGSHWGYAMATGILGVSLPIHAIAALVLAVAMAAYPDAIFRLRLRGLAAAVAFVGLASLAALLVDGVRRAFEGPHRRLPFKTEQWAPWALVVSLVVLYALLSRRRDEADSATSKPDPAGRLFARIFEGVPWRALVPVAFILATTAFAWITEMDAGSAILWFPIFLTTAILPTTLCYLLVLTAAYQLLARRAMLSALLLGVALLPFAHWAYLRQVAQWDAERETAEIRAIETYSPAVLPAEVVIEGHAGRWTSFADLSQFKSVYVGSPGDYHRFDLTSEARASQDAVKVEGLPAEYLVLRTGTASVYRELGRGHGGPFELAYVSPGGEELVALRYYGAEPVPAFFPVLTFMGWMPASNSVDSRELEAQINAFVEAALTEGQSAL